MQVCSTAFVGLGRAQASALGYPQLHIAVVPHPFGLLKRDQLRDVARKCSVDIAKLACEAVVPIVRETSSSAIGTIQVAGKLDAINQLFRVRGWTDGLPIVPPTAERLQAMLKSTPLAGNTVIGEIAPGFGAATVERIAINAVMAGCDPIALPVLIAAVQAIVKPEFNLQAIQATTNPVAPWLIVNGPIVARLGMNAGINCLGQGNWANATLGRAIRLILQNIGHALPGEMDRATHGQPGKYVFCCAENEEQNPWEPVHVERGYKREQSTVTMVGAEGTLNMNTHCRDPLELMRLFAETLPRAASNDYRMGGEPWVILSPEHASIFAAAGWSKLEVKRRLWEGSKLSARRMAAVDRDTTQSTRGSELGTISLDTMIPVCPVPERLGIIVAGGAGTHSVYVPSYGTSRSITRVIE